MRKNFLILLLISFTFISSNAQQIPIVETINAETTSKSIFPETLLGNWLKTDGSNEWMYGFYENMAIYNNEFWDNIVISNKGKNYQIQLQKVGKSIILFAKLAKKGNILIGTDPDKLELMCRNKTTKENYVIMDDEDFGLPVFKQDTAIYKGFIKDYNPRWGKTGMAYVDNILTNKQIPSVITINPNGTFEFKCPLLYPQRIYVTLPTMALSVFLEPGKTTVQFIDPTESRNRFKKEKVFAKHDKKSLFMGNGARVNVDLQAVDSIDYFNYKINNSEIINMNADQYKTYCLDVLKREQETLQKHLEKNQMCKKALTSFRLEIQYRAYNNILSYEMHKKYAIERKNNTTGDKQEKEEIKPEYYSFIQPNELNSPVSLVSRSYGFLLSNMNSTIKDEKYLFKGDTYLTSPSILYVAFLDSVKSQNIKIGTDEQALLNKLIASKSVENRNKIHLQDSTVSNQFFKKYRQLFSTICDNEYDKLRNKELQKYFGLTDGLAREIMFSQRMNLIIDSEKKPFSVEDKQRINRNIKSTFIADYLMQCSKVSEDEIKKTLNENKSKTGYKINETPKTAGDKVFDAILQKYKGKVVFVDFWATSCGPCIQGIKKMKPIKEELKDKDVVFLYLTSDSSSPLDTWNLMIPDIKGEHYRISTDEWNYMKTRFKFNGIPHYTIVNKEGEVVKNGIYFNLEGSEFKNMIEGYLK